MAVPTVNVLSLCSGAGMLDLGVRLAVPSARTVGYVEREAFAAACLMARMEEEALDEAPVWDDLATFDGRPWRGVVDIVAGGYPCQGQSTAGKRLGTADDRWLWPHVARIVREVEPEWVFFENVGNHLRIGFDVVRADLLAMGYRTEAGLFSAAEAGAPHRRERLFILGHAESRGFGAAGFHAGDPGRGSVLADTGRIGEHGLQPVGVNGRSRAASLGVAGRSMAHACRDGHEDGGCAEPAGASATRGGHAPVADSESQGRGAVGYRRLKSTQPRLEPDCLPYFPPGPSNSAGWAQVLACMPEAEPALCKLADGPASRLDRSRRRYRPDQLRVVGNGVVPVVAGFALTVLAERMSQ